MRILAWYLVALAASILIGSCTGYAAHEVTQNQRHCDATTWDVHETSNYCVLVAYGAANARTWEF